MQLNGPTLATLFLTSVGAVVSAPVLAKGFGRRGKGVKYEKDFLIQRAPQFCSLFNIALVALSFCVYSNIISAPALVPFFALTIGHAQGILQIVSWLGVLILISGLIFMIGGWYSLGEAFSTDAEILEGQQVRSGGLLAFVMHPAYSGIIQSLLGASIAATSPVATLFVLCVVMPLWLNRAKYEEKILLETLGPSYKEYAENMRWRRLVPKFFPIGV